MDRKALDTLAEAGVDVTLKQWIPHVPLMLDRETREPVAIGDDVPVVSGDAVTTVRLAPVGALYAGSRVPPDFYEGPTEEYVPFFATIEQTAANFCSTARIISDDEFERTYRAVKRHPDERTKDILFSYIRAAVRLYMSLRDVSPAELEAVLRRLARSARTFRMGPSTVNYYQYALTSFGAAR